MSYFDPKIFHVDNLKKEHRDEILTADFLISETLTQMKNNDFVDSPSTILEKISLEEQRRALDSIWETYLSNRMEIIVFMMETYDDDFEPIEREPEEFGTYEEYNEKITNYPKEQIVKEDITSDEN